MSGVKVERTVGIESIGGTLTFKRPGHEKTIRIEMEEAGENNIYTIMAEVEDVINFAYSLLDLAGVERE